MKAFALAGAIALVGGLSFAAPAFAGYYDVYGNYHPTVREYRYETERERDVSMSRSNVRVALEEQGYDYVRNLHRVGFSNEWSAVAYFDGDWVRVTIDGGSGRIIDVDQI